MKRSNLGFTLVEALVATGIIVIGGMALVEGLSSIRNISTNTQLLSSTEKQINEIAENIRGSLSNYQINFNYTDSDRESILNAENLPMAWDVGVITTPEKCGTCQGRFGYIIQPLDLFRGLYNVTIRMTHKSWSEPFRDYQFVVTVK